MAERLIFAQTFEGLFRAVGADLSVRLARELERLGVDPARPLRPAYPLATFQAVFEACGAELFPDLDQEGRRYALGRRFLDGYRQTMVGRAMVAVMRVVGPARTLDRLARRFRTGNNFSETSLTRVDDTTFELWCNQVQMPGWYRGLITRGLELAGAMGVTAELLRHDEHGATFRVSWQA